MLWWHCLMERAPHVGLSGQLLVRRDFFGRTSLPGKPLVLHHETLTVQLEHSDTDGEVELGQVQHRLDRNIESAAELGESGKKWAPVRHGPDKARKTFPRTLSRRTVRFEPGRKPKSTSRRASCLPRSRCTKAVAEQRSSHHTTTERTTHGAEH